MRGRQRKRRGGKSTATSTGNLPPLGCFSPYHSTCHSCRPTTPQGTTKPQPPTPLNRQKRNNKLFDLHVYSGHCFPSLGCFQQVLGRFWAKTCGLWPSIAYFEIEVRPLRCMILAAIVQSIAHILCDCPSPPKLWWNLKHHYGGVIFAHFTRACGLPACLLAACQVCVVHRRH